MSTAHINAAKKGDIAESILLPGDPLRAKYIAETFLDQPFCYNEIRGMLGYTGRYKGVPVSVQGSGMGMPSMGIYSYELINEYGVRNLIRVGSAGSFHEDIDLMDIVVGLSASTDSNWQHTYRLPGTFAPCCDFDLLMKVKDTADEQGIKIRAGNLVSCDVFYEDDPDWWKNWAKLGVLGVEMEAAALYMNAARLGAKALAIVTISDHFITGGRLTAEERERSFTEMMTLALEAAVR
ncbi:MAG: purine-nucleoside phosphorylase [Firmicutes bacterium HGW-Firmicutes-11]|jgi:purine-nucleoside phosphorylase|nr:MAG: purine-nucleoside phosphorylase [Firmicutes bacterium HGW-Firmicutes-11]